MYTPKRQMREGAGTAGDAHAPASTKSCVRSVQTRHGRRKRQKQTKPSETEGWVAQTKRLGSSKKEASHICYLGPGVAHTDCALARPHLWLLDSKVRTSLCCGVEKIELWVCDESGRKWL